MMVAVAEGVERKLYDAASKGHAITLEDLHRQDPLIHHGFPFAGSRNLAHLATLCGQVGLVEEALKINPRLARGLDSHKSSPLHIAAAEGNLDIASILLRVAPEVCWWRDGHDMNPVHIAAINGHVELLKELLQPDPSPAAERAHRGQTVLHLCVKHRQLRALEVLVDELGGLVRAKDDDGETVLHLAVRSNQVEVISLITKMLEGLPKNLDYEAGYKIGQMAMVVVILIATMAFQAAASPPGGVWQDDTSAHRAGESVMASTHPQVYKHFTRANTTAFVSSLVIIFLISTGLTLVSDTVGGFVILAMLLSLASIAVSYGASLMVTTPGMGAQSFVPTIVTVALVSAGMFGSLLLFLTHKRKDQKTTVR